MKIFISIASYQDPLLKTTILSAFEKAHMPQNLHFAVCDQSTKSIDIVSLGPDIKISYEHINPHLSEGPCWARHRIQGMYQNEDFFLQIDSHMQFEEKWDEYLIGYITKIQSESLDDNTLPIITCYPRAFDVIDLDSGVYKLHDEDKSTQTIAYREDSLFLKGAFSRQIGASSSTEITHGYLIAAGCLFAPGTLIKDVPYDPDFYFYGEEISLMLRAFTRGYGIYHIPSVPIYHLYADITNLKRKLHWDEEEDSAREVKWHKREENSIKRLTNLINGSIKGVYGLGEKRDLKDYESISGIDLKNRIVKNRTKALTAEHITNLPWEKSPF